MAIDRRTLLTGGCGLALALAGIARGPRSASAASKATIKAAGERRGGGQPSEALFAAARRSVDGSYSAAIFRAGGDEVNAVALPARGHDVCVNPVTKTAVVFARRPGNFAVAFGANRSVAPVHFSTPANRHFYGHGVFSHDGRLLFATENDFEAGAGRIGLYDATAGFRRLGEWDAHGIGPHDLALAADGSMLVIANGGIETHPDIGGGRTKLNLATMSPALAYLDTRTGDLIARYDLPRSMRKLSLRHIGVGAGRTVFLGGQIQRGAAPDTPLILRHRLSHGEELERIDLPRRLAASLRGYISSVAIDAAGDIAALTAARGGAVIYVDVATGRYKGLRRLRDVSGVAAVGDGFILTTGDGAIVTADGHVQTPWQWDNHAELIA